MHTALVVIVTAAIIEANHYFFDRRHKVMVARTIATLMNDLADLSEKAGCRSWIEYLEKTHGTEESTLYLHQLHTVLQKNRVRGDQYDLLQKKLGEYLRHISGQSGPVQGASKDGSKSSL